MTAWFRRPLALGAGAPGRCGEAAAPQRVGSGSAMRGDQAGYGRSPGRMFIIKNIVEYRKI